MEHPRLLQEDLVESALATALLYRDEVLTGRNIIHVSHELGVIGLA
jgi:hypothetical protein